MQNQKPLIFTVLILAVITALATFAIKKGTLQRLRNLSKMAGDDAVLMQEGKMVGYAGDMAELAGEDEMAMAPQGAGANSRADSAGVRTLDRRVTPYSPGIIPIPINDNALDVENRVYEKSSYHEVVAENVNSYLRNIKEYILSVDGRVLSTSQSSTDKYQYGQVYAKIPVEKFDEATGRITSEVKKIISESINAQDRTGQLVSQGESLEKLEDQKAEKEIELIQARTEVERRRIELEIDRLEKQIDRVKQQLASSETRVTYASVQVMAADDERFFNPTDAKPGLKEELLQAWESAKTVLYSVAQIAIWVVVYAVIWLPVIILLKLAWKLLGKKESGKEVGSAKTESTEKKAGKK